MQIAEVIFFRLSELAARPEELARGRQFTTKVHIVRSMNGNLEAVTRKVACVNFCYMKVVASFFYRLCRSSSGFLLESEVVLCRLFNEENRFVLFVVVP